MGVLDCISCYCFLESCWRSYFDVGNSIDGNFDGYNHYNSLHENFLWDCYARLRLRTRLVKVVDDHTWLKEDHALS